MAWLEIQHLRASSGYYNWHIIEVRRDLSDKVSPSFFSHGSPSRLSRITDSSAIAWLKPHSASVWVCTPTNHVHLLASVIDSEPYWLTCMRYLEENPVRPRKPTQVLGDERFRVGDRAPERAPRGTLTPGATEEKQRMKTINRV